MLHVAAIFFFELWVFLKDGARFEFLGRPRDIFRVFASFLRRLENHGRVMMLIRLLIRIP